MYVWHISSSIGILIDLRPEVSFRIACTHSLTLGFLGLILRNEHGTGAIGGLSSWQHTRVVELAGVFFSRMGWGWHCRLEHG